MNLVEFVFKAAHESDLLSKPALVCGDEAPTYEQLFRQVKKFGGLLRSLKIERGDRIAIVARDGPQFVVSFLGSAAVGAIAVPVSTMLSSEELEYVLGHCSAKALIAAPDQFDKIRGVRGCLSSLETVLAAEGMLGFDELLSQADEAEIEAVEPETPAFILYTSGSTGRPKGAVHLHRNLPYTVECFCRKIIKVEPEDRLFSSSRLFFAYGLGNSLSFPLSSAATAILSKERPTPSVIAEVFEKHRPTIFFGVPAVYRALIEHISQGNNIEMGSIKFCVSAGEKLPEKIFDEWKELTGLDILDGIGSTEMLHMFISNDRDEIRRGSSGKTVFGYEAKIADPSGREITGAGTGNLMIKGLSACSGYWMDPEKSAAIMDGEWMRTGDVYRIDEDGFYWFEGRSDDLFKVKGLWVSPVEVEEALLSCPEVLEAAVVSGTGEDGTNIAVAYVVLRSAYSLEEDIVERLTAQIGPKLQSYKRPSEIKFIDCLPRTATGKLQRYKLREA